MTPFTREYRITPRSSTFDHVFNMPGVFSLISYTSGRHDTLTVVYRGCMMSHMSCTSSYVVKSAVGKWNFSETCWYVMFGTPLYINYKTGLPCRCRDNGTQYIALFLTRNSTETTTLKKVINIYELKNFLAPLFYK